MSLPTFFFNLQKGTKAKENNLCWTTFCLHLSLAVRQALLCVGWWKSQRSDPDLRPTLGETELPALYWDLERLFWGMKKKGGGEEVIPTGDKRLPLGCSPK